MPAKELCKTLVKRFILFLIYTTLGMFIFYFIERNQSTSFIEKSQSLQAKLKNKLQKQCNMSDSEFSSLIIEFKAAFRDNGLEWNFLNAHYFVVQLITTIGYGNITPKTTLGRMMSVLYALIGIPLAALLFQAIGKILSEHQKIILCTLERRILKHEGTIKHQAAKASVMTLSASLTFVLCGAGHYRYLHGPNTYFDGVYAWFMTLTTVGFGDFVAAQPDKQNMSSILQPLVILLGLCALSTAFANISECFKEGYFNVNIFSCSSCCEKGNLGNVIKVNPSQIQMAEKENQTLSNRPKSTY